MSEPAAAAAELYVYYRLKAEQAAAALAAFTAARGDAAVRLLQRPPAEVDAAEEGGEDGLLTWMEVYTCPALEPRIAAALAGFVQGERHHERFVPLI